MDEKSDKRKLLEYQLADASKLTKRIVDGDLILLDYVKDIERAFKRYEDYLKQIGVLPSEYRTADSSEGCISQEDFNRKRCIVMDAILDFHDGIMRVKKVREGYIGTEAEKMEKEINQAIEKQEYARRRVSLKK